MTYKFKLYKDKKGEWRWSLYASNGRKVADSAEGYKNKSAAYRFPDIVVYGENTGFDFVDDSNTSGR